MASVDRDHSQYLWSAACAHLIIAKKRMTHSVHDADALLLRRVFSSSREEG